MENYVTPQIMGNVTYTFQIIRKEYEIKICSIFI